MNKQKFIFIIEFIFEIIHTIFFLLVSSGMVSQSPFWQEQLWGVLLILAASKLAIPLGFLFLVYDDRKFSSFLYILRPAKFFSIFTGILVFGGELWSNRFYLMVNTFYAVKDPLLFPLLIFLIFDLIFLYFLLSFKIEEIKVVENSMKSLIEAEVIDEEHEGAINEDHTNRQW